MFQFVGRFEKLALRGARFNDAFKKSLEVQMRQAARAFLREVIVHVPVYTGMARGSLIPLGRFLRVAIPIKPHPDAKRRYPHKNAAVGAANSSFVFSNRSGFNPNLAINIGVLHYKLNESRPSDIPLKHPTPWRSFQYGREAFKEYLRENLQKKVPRIIKFITRTRVVIR